MHWVVLVDRKRVLKIPPDQTKDGVVQRRCHSVQMHTSEDSSLYLPSSSHTSRQQLTLKAWWISDTPKPTGLVQHCEQYTLTSYDNKIIFISSFTLPVLSTCIHKCCVQWGGTGWGSLFLLSTMLQFYLTTILHSALYTFTAHRKILCSVCISDKTQ